MDVSAACPHCKERFLWDVDLQVEQELAWRAPHSPRFPFHCPTCSGRVVLSFRWSLEPGANARPLRVVGGSRSAPLQSCVLLVDHCPHGCGATLGLQIPPDDPWATEQVDAQIDHVLGGYRCPHCDGEGRLRIGLRVQGS